MPDLEGWLKELVDLSAHMLSRRWSLIAWLMRQLSPIQSAATLANNDA